MSTTPGDFNSAEQEPYEFDEHGIGFADDIGKACASGQRSENINDGGECEAASGLPGLTWLQVLHFFKAHGFATFVLPLDVIAGTYMRMEVRSVDEALTQEEAGLEASNSPLGRTRYFVEVGMTQDATTERVFTYEYPRPACLTDDITWSCDVPSRLPPELLVENVFDDANRADPGSPWNFKSPDECVGLRRRRP
jgi:hypothetical protein